MGKDAAHDSSATIAGFDRGAVEAWLRTVTEIAPPVAWTQLKGGHSNLTYLLRDSSGRELVVRRPPQGPLLPKAHDMWREYRIIEGLWPTAVPVAEPVGYCDDRSVADAHFYVMGKAGGIALYEAGETGEWLDVSARRRASEDFADVLAALHALEPAAVGLADLGRPDGYLERQIGRWYAAWTSKAAEAEHDDPRVHELYGLLEAKVPTTTSVRIVHGDYGPHNALFERDGRISAVLDWEIATIGDPLADLGYSVNAWAGPGDDPVDRPESATGLPGFYTRDEIVARYVQQTGADLSDFDYYRAFNYWKRACIVHGVYARYKAGQKSSDGVDVPGLLHRMDKFLGAAAALAERIA